jgi:PKD repeat protein
MKKLLLQIAFLLLVIPAFSQGFISVSGTVTDSLTGSPIANHAVTIRSDSSSGLIYYNIEYTNAQGLFVDTIPVTLGVAGILFIETLDCNNVLHQDVWSFTPMQSHVSNFSICNSTGGSCQANFTYSVDSSNLVQFADLSVGNPSVVSWLWNFGDPASGANNTSTVQNPVHAYPLPGTYTVCLTIQGAAGCSDIACETIVVGNTGGCQAAFIFYADTLNPTTNAVQFIDQSTTTSGVITTWAWDFGDGSPTVTVVFPGNPNVLHSYAAAGTYTACLTIHGSDSTCFDLTCETVSIGSGAGCNAQFTYYADTLSSPNTIHFIDQSTTSSGVITTWIWNFGDGQVQTITFPGSPNVTHTYATSGTYTVCLNIQGSDSTCYDQICHSVSIVPNVGCIANFSYSNPITSSPVQFVDLSQTAGAGPVTSWTWDFGDPASGVNNTSSAQNPTHQFITAGSYTVCLTIHGTDSLCYDMLCKTIIVTGDSTGCQANFSHATNPATGNSTIYFTDLSTGNPTNWLWDFGDGGASSQQNPVHTYAMPGTYSVCLTITANTCTSMFCQQVVIQDSTVYHQVYGQVFEGSFPLSPGMVMIFSLDSTTNYQPYFDVYTIDSNGVYYFSMVPDGNYYIMAIPFDSNGYLPTYYGNTINWEQATLISLGTPNNPYNINLVAASQTTPGPGSASGQINMGDVSTSMLDKISMILKNAQGEAIGFTSVSSSGSFAFSSLAYGTYYLYPELPGVTGDNVMITITSEKPHADVVMTFTGKKILGIHDAASLANQWSVYPNPVGDNFTVSIDMKQATRGSLEIHNLAGQLVNISEVNLSAGSNILGFSAASLPAGIYTLHLYSPDGLNINTKLVKTR